jgi:hypothetical protein
LRRENAEVWLFEIRITAPRHEEVRYRLVPGIW